MSLLHNNRVEVMAWQNSPLLPNGICLETVCVCVLSLNHVQLFVTPWTIPHQALLFMGISWQEYWNVLGSTSLGDHPNPGIEFVSPVSSAMQVESLLLSHWGSLFCVLEKRKHNYWAGQKFCPAFHNIL